MMRSLGTISGGIILTNGTIGSKLISIMKHNPVAKAIHAAGSGPKLAERLGVSARAIYKWSARWDEGRMDAVPPGRAIQIEAATGIPRSELRPDLWSEDDAISQAAA